MMDWASYLRTSVAYIVGTVVGTAEMVFPHHAPLAIGGGVLCSLLLTIRKRES